ncbi:glycerophosphoryl diester phosphodiesterase [Rhodopirellula maiorica SM1]|uniref:Glycerophosphoryl diester phosphodiesterase n=1 Tax=Rhodopirellula maiorica SM1 TaxID=1265738 RepID=M5RJ26_9BACT|nr:glycerophosphodiester phosphodiesterase [Rhodopirellula maiorica]EMI15372.1 glycerophosphoryl diester phosphodiesterase [Rhodopirellula maiorica SM1]
MRSRLIPLFVLVVSFSLPQLASSQMIVAHRGASHDAPENTLSAFRLAWDQNADGVEGDFYLTADSKIVCIHDKDTKRTAGKKMVVQGSTLADLRQLDAGKWKDEKWANEPIPTFAEVLQTVPEDRTFVIEIKSDERIVPFLKAELDQLDHSKIKLLIISFNDKVIADCKRLLPNVKSHWLTSFKQNKTTGVWTPTADQIAKTVKKSGANGVGMQGNTQVINTDFIATLKQGGCDEFHVWTVDSPADARHFADLGAFGITTNRPAFIRDALETEPAAN